MTDPIDFTDAGVPSGAPALLSADAILKADDRAERYVDVPEWGGTVRVRELSGVQRDRFEVRMALARKNPTVTANVRAGLVSAALVDADGHQLFTERQVATLGEKSAAVLDRLFDIVQELSGMAPESVEEAAEDFGHGPDDGSSSA